MTTAPLNLLLADDDRDDCIFFKEALEELPIATNLITVIDGVLLMNHLNKDVKILPDALFLDLNMPRKTGYECLLEIRQNHKLKQLTVIVFSTSLDAQKVNELHENGAHYYIQKPAEFSDLKKVILKSLQLIEQANNQRPPKENFVINSA